MKVDNNKLSRLNVLGFSRAEAETVLTQNPPPTNLLERLRKRYKSLPAWGKKIARQGMKEKEFSCDVRPSPTKPAVAAPEAVSEPVDYYTYINSPEWQERAYQAKIDADYHCQVCYGTKDLHAHHRTYIRLGHELPSDLTVLCADCHELFHKNRKLWR